MTDTIPQNQFDFMAGGKAAYEAFHLYTLHDRNPRPWERLLAERQEHWRKIAKAGTVAAMRAAAEKRQTSTKSLSGLLKKRSRELTPVMPFPRYGKGLGGTKCNTQPNQIWRQQLPHMTSGEKSMNN
jgi:hypothetical protein